MDLNQDPYTASPRPGTASVRVTDIGWHGPLNPTPFLKEEKELLLDDYLSPSKLQALTGFDDLHHVKTLEMCVDTRENSLGNFGSYLPNLQHLKLNNSMIASVRDLGTTLSNVKVLWMAWCGLVDLDGMSSFTSVKELYLAYNNLSDLSEVSMIDHLEILDLEGNNIDDIMQIQYLGLCSKLSTLTLEDNPIVLKPHPDSSMAEDYDYPTAVKKLIPHLKCLDEVPLDQSTRRLSIAAINKDWLMVKEAIKDLNITVDNAQHESRPRTAAGRLLSNRRPHTAQPMMTVRPQTAQRPRTSSWRPGSAHLTSGSSPFLESTNSSEMLAEDDASSLTHGISRVICGNPIKALRTRRETFGASPVSSLKKQEHCAEPTYETTNTDRDDLFVELQAWREKHKEHLQAILNEQKPQVMKIMQSDEDVDSLSGSSDEEQLRQQYDDDGNWSGQVSSDASWQSPPSQTPTVPASQAQEGSPSVTLFNSRFLTPAKCPTPPPARGAINNYQRMKDIRIRRLRVHSQQDNTLCTTDIRTELADEAYALMDFISASQGPELAMRKPVEKRNGLVHSENDIKSPIIGQPVVKSTYIGSTVDRSPSNVVISHQPVIRSSAERIRLFKTVRTLPSKGTVQRLPNRPALLIAPSKNTNS